ncbi:MAG TPA: M2 family metallopeptidase [Myxococcales bacterium]|nr:M2 family metallopeptidase [Myxococcales bacterium]
MKSTSFAALAAALLSCAPAATRQRPAATTSAQVQQPSSGDPKQFVARVNEDLKRLFAESSTADWIKNTYITGDTERNAAAANERVLAYQSEAAKTAASFKDMQLDPDTSRMLYLLRISSPVMEDPARRLEMTSLAARLEGYYGAAKDAKGRDLEDLEKIIDHSRNYDTLLDAWVSWHDTAREQRPRYARFVELQNEAARGAGFANMGDMWRAGYDMPPAQFEQETDRLWSQVKPLYDSLHCYVRTRLQKTYGKDKVPDGKPIPAHLLGNMWAQDWENIYPLVEPYKGIADLDVQGALAEQKWDPLKVVKTGEAFFVSMGLDPLPQTFWQRSMFVKPRDRDVVCHASAWDVTFADDLRIKMCIPTPPREEDLTTVHHELGHDYYFHAYYRLPVLYQNGANDGFHEAIGDSLVLSMTPGYLKKLGVVPALAPDPRATINVQMKRALGKVAFLPFGKLIDQWRWDVFSGKTPPADYEKAWWALREKYQGVSAPVARSEQDFDPGAKYHVPGNTPYTRYFLADILQFQFYRAMCQAAGHKGSLHECSFFGSKEAGQRLWKMLSLGASKPWPDALEAMTGQRQMDGSALLEYFQPLQAWLAKQNQGTQCGW